MTDPIRLPPPTAASPLFNSNAVGDARSATAAGPGFQDVLLQSLNQVNELDRHSQTAIATGLAENDLSQAEVFTAVKKADLALRTMLQIRNKLLDAYNEIKNIRM